MSAYKTFAVAGPGALGQLVVQELLKLQKASKLSSVSFLSRSNSGNDNLVAKGAQRIVVNYDDPATITRSLTRVDVVVSTLSGIAGLDAQEKLLTAAKEANVKLFVASEFGPIKGSTNNQRLQAKEAFMNRLKMEDVPYTAFSVGVVTDFLFAPPIAKMFGFDFTEGKVKIQGEGIEPISFTSRADIASYVAHVLTFLPKEKIEGRIFRIEGDRISLSGIIEAYEKHTGKKLDVTHRPRAEIEEAVKQNPADLASDYAIEWDAGRGVVGTVDELDNKEYPEWKTKKVVEVLDDIYG